MKGTRSRTPSTTTIWSSASSRRARRRSTCASATRPGSSRTPPRLGAARRDVARLLTVARQRGIDLDKELRVMAEEEKQETTEETAEARGPAEESPPPRRRLPTELGRGARGRRGPGREAARGACRRGAEPTSLPEPRSRLPRSRLRPQPTPAATAEPEEVADARRSGASASAPAHTGPARSRSAPRRSAPTERASAAAPPPSRRRAAIAPRAAASAASPARAPRRPSASPGQEGPPGHGRLRQGGQDDHGRRSSGRAPPDLREGRAPHQQAAGPRRGATRRSEGDIVRVVESRPLSKTKRWRLLEVVERARQR